MDDSKTVVLSLDSENLIQGPIGSIAPSLIVRCQEKKTAVYVVTGMAARIEEDVDGGPSGYHKVRIRIDDGAASSESWTEATDHKALFAGDELCDIKEHYVVKGWRIALAKRLAEATTLNCSVAIPESHNEIPMISWAFSFGVCQSDYIANEFSFGTSST